MFNCVFKKLFCAHKWETKEEGIISHEERGERVVTGKLFTLQCKECGDIKSRKIVV